MSWEMRWWKDGGWVVMFAVLTMNVLGDGDKSEDDDGCGGVAVLY